MQRATRETNLDKFAERLKESRKSKGLSQGELAEKAGFHLQHISRYERGITLPSADALKKLSAALEVSTEYLIDSEQSSFSVIQKSDPEMTKRLLAIESLPAEDKETVKKLLDAFLIRQRVQDLKAM
jgi:transcriptional regulator with XRE-family HTH domain